MAWRECGAAPHLRALARHRILVAHPLHPRNVQKRVDVARAVPIEAENHHQLVHRAHRADAEAAQDRRKLGHVDRAAVVLVRLLKDDEQLLARVGEHAHQRVERRRRQPRRGALLRPERGGVLRLQLCLVLVVG